METLHETHPPRLHRNNCRRLCVPRTRSASAETSPITARPRRLRCPRSRSSSAPPTATTISIAAMPCSPAAATRSDAVMQVITGPEDDPNDDSVGLGGLPNEDCVVATRRLLHAWADAHGGVGGRRRRDQERFAAGEDRDGAHRSRDAGGRGRAEVRLQDGLPAREPADRALAQDLAAVARDHVERRLVGTGAGQPEIQVPAERRRQRVRAPRRAHATRSKNWRQRSASSRSFAWRRSSACCSRRPEPFTARR